MPRHSRIRLRALEDLARQLRYSPKAAAIRQIRAVLALAEEIDPSHAYPEEWVVRRITGYRAEIEDPAQLVGLALLADLSAFVERISSQARLVRADVPEGQSESISLAALMKRWRVTARTIERYRRRGLIGLRLLDDSGRPRNEFPMAQVERFERREPDLLRRAAAFRRVERSRREEIIAAATGDGARGAVSRAAKSLAPRFGVSRDTVRRILIAGDSAARTLRDGSSPGRAESRRRAAFEHWTRGRGPAETARALGVTRASIHRLIEAERVRRLKGIEPLLTEVPPDEARGLTRETLAQPIVREGLGAPGDADAARLVAGAAAARPMSMKHERMLAQANRLLCARAATGIRTLGARPRPAAIDRIETDLRWASLLRIELVRAQRGLIIRSIEERLGGSILALPPGDMRRWLAVSFSAAADAVARFDPASGGRLATPVSLALARVLAGLARRSNADAARAHAAALTIDDWSLSIAPWQAWLMPPAPVLVAVERGVLDRDDEAALRRRYGLAIGPPLTLDELRREHGCTAARLARLIRTIVAAPA